MKIIAIILFVLSLSACNDKVNKSISGQDVIASNENSNISFAALKNYINLLPHNDQWNNSHDLDTWYENTIKQMLVHKSIVEEAELVGFNQDQSYLSKLQQLRRNFITSQYFKDQVSFNIEVTAKEIKGYYEENIDKYKFTERRKVHNIFIAKKDSKQKAIENIENLKSRIDTGESFSIIAKTHSESETRHKNGLIGIIEKGTLSEAFDQIVFSLEKNKSSEVVHSKEGYHIFYVSEIVPAQNFKLKDVENLITQHLYKTEVLNKIEAIAKDFENYQQLKIVDAKELINLRNSGQLMAPVISLNDFSFTLKDFLEYLKDANTKPKNQSEIYDQLKEIAYMEVIYQTIRSSEDTEISKDIKHLENKLLIEHYLPTKMVVFLNNHPEILQEYYQNNLMRFASPTLLSFNYYEFKNDNLAKIMPILEADSVKLNSELMALEELKNTHNPKITRHQSRNNRFISQLDSKIIKHIYKLKPGQFSAPYTVKESIVIIHLTDRIEAKPQPLSLIREHVMNSYINENAGFLYNQISAGYLKSFKFKPKLIKQIHQQLTSF